MMAIPLFTTLILSAGAALTAASPISNSDLAISPTRLSDRATTCTFTDAATAKESKTACSTIILSNIDVPAGTTLDMTDLNDGTHVTFTGTTTFGYSEWKGPLISFSGSSITITGASGSVIDGDGSRWWDGEGSNGGKTKPKFFYAHDLSASSISGLTIKNTPVQCFSIDGADDLTISDVVIDDSDGDENGGHNTDGFDVGDSDGVIIQDVKVYNQDDCLAINSGNNITFTGSHCSGSHGLSIGSIGGRSNNNATNISILSSTITSAANGLRIKTISGATGLVSGVTFADIAISNISSYGVVIEQDYENGSPTGTPTDGVLVEGVVLRNVTGSVQDDATEVYILCGDDSCRDWTWEDVDITGGKKSEKCENVPEAASC